MTIADANILVVAFLKGPATEAVRAALGRDDRWTAPPLWRAEVRSALLKYLRRGDLARGGALAVLKEADRLVREERFAAAPLVLELAMRSGCSAYDCEYVALALELGTRLVTLDTRLQKAFPRVAIDPAAFAA